MITVQNVVLISLILACTASAQTREASNACVRLLDAPDDAACLGQLKASLRGLDNEADRCAYGIAYYLGCLQTRNFDEAKAMQTALQRMGSRTEPVLISREVLGDLCKQCMAGTQKQRCANCGGSGSCAKCGGKGRRPIGAMSVSWVTCVICKTTGKCPTCGGSGKSAAPCASCQGAGYVQSAPKVLQTYRQVLQSLASGTPLVSGGAGGDTRDALNRALAKLSGLAALDLLRRTPGFITWYLLPETASDAPQTESLTTAQRSELERTGRAALLEKALCLRLTDYGEGLALLLYPIPDAVTFEVTDVMEVQGGFQVDVCQVEPTASGLGRTANGTSDAPHTTSRTSRSSTPIGRSIGEEESPFSSTYRYRPSYMLFIPGGASAQALSYNKGEQLQSKGWFYCVNARTASLTSSQRSYGTRRAFIEPMHLVAYLAENSYVTFY